MHLKIYNSSYITLLTQAENMHIFPKQYDKYVLLDEHW